MDWAEAAASGRSEAMGTGESRISRVGCGIYRTGLSGSFLCW